MEARGADNGEIRADMHGFARAHRGREHIAGKEALPGRGGNQADIHLVIPVRPGVAVLDEDLLALKIGQQPVMDEIEFFRGKRLVLFPPMNLGGAGGLFDNEFILGRAAGIGAGAHYHRPQVGDESFLLGDDFFVQSRGG